MNDFLSLTILAQGGSMWPLIKGNDLLFYKIIDESSIQKGQIILYRKSDGQIICHRFHKITDGHFLFKGDARINFDEPVFPSQILGQVTSIKRGKKKITEHDTLWHFIKFIQLEIIGPMAQTTDGIWFLSRFYRLIYRFLKVFHVQD